MSHLLPVAVMLALAAGMIRAAGPTTEMAGAANGWLQSLEPAQHKRATFAFETGERENWHYVPRSRKGISLGEMNGAQRTAARRLLAAGLSLRGQLEVEAIIALENVLRVVEDASYRDPARYFFSVFGEPGLQAPWGWRVEGHHLSINFTVIAGQVAATPLFFGANPAEVHIDHAHRGRRTLAREEDLGRALAKSLDAAQRKIAIIANRAPSEIITGADREVQPLSPAGLACSAMNPEQQGQLRALVEVYAGRLRGDLAAAELAKIAEHGWDLVHFAWAGGLEKVEGHYYRIQGPAFLIEYDNTQDRANHIHTTWRNFEGDFGRDLLREHYQREHKAVR